VEISYSSKILQIGFVPSFLQKALGKLKFRILLDSALCDGNKKKEKKRKGKTAKLEEASQPVQSRAQRRAAPALVAPPAPTTSAPTARRRRRHPPTPTFSASHTSGHGTRGPAQLTRVLCFTPEADAARRPPVRASPCWAAIPTTRAPSACRAA